MRNNNFFTITVLLAAGAGLLLVACSGDDSSSSPLQPSPLATAPAGTDPQGLPAAQVRLTSGAGTPEGAYGLRADSRDGFNAYDFFAGYDDGMLSLALVEDEMRSMREASKPHRTRRVTVEHCPVEPHHALQSCGTALWTGRVRLAGRVELDPIPLPACEGWIVVHADELFDDVWDGWRNAPCPAAGGGAVGSDGSGDGWPDYPEPDRPAGPAGTDQPADTPVQRTVNKTLAAAGGLVAGRGPLDVVDVIDLFKGTEGTTGDDYRPTPSDPTVATVEMTDNPKVRVTPLRPGTVTIEVVFLRTGETVAFSVPVLSSASPAITAPGDRSYVQGAEIEAFRILVTDADGDDVTVTVAGLPPGLTWSPETGMVSGTVASGAAARAYPVTVTASDGVASATATFTITVLSQAPPTIMAPEDRSYMQGVAIEAFRILATAANAGDPVTVTVAGLPMGLTYSPETGMVSGTVALGAAVHTYLVTVTATDGAGNAATETFLITVEYQTTRLYDANGPYTFLRVSGTTVDRIHIAFLMLDRAVCPTTGTNVRYGGVGRLRGSGTTVLEFRWNNIGPAPWVRGSSYARITNPDGPGADLSVYRFRGGPARIASEVFPSMAFDLISPVKDPQGLAPPTKTREAVPPYAPGASGQTYYVTDSVDLTLTIDATTPGFTLPTDGTYCLVEMATCSATGSVFCA